MLSSRVRPSTRVPVTITSFCWSAGVATSAPVGAASAGSLACVPDAGVVLCAKAGEPINAARMVPVKAAVRS